MEPEGSLSCLQKSATGPYSEPGESSPLFNTLLLRLVLILSCIYALVSKVIFSPRDFRLKLFIYGVTTLPPAQRM
jgi:hypothetical protein